MQHRDVAEARAEPADRLGGQGDLGHQHDGAAPEGEGGLDRLQVHLRLAAARHALEEEGLVAARLERLGEGPDGGLLRLGEALRPPAAGASGRQRIG